MTERGARVARERALDSPACSVTAASAASAAATQVRPEVSASWRRVRAGGLAPGAEPAVEPLSEDQVEARLTSGALASLLPVLRSALAPVVDDGHLVVLCDPEGRVVWREGRTGVRRRADRLGFVRGSSWTEANVGTNAIGTCLVEGGPVHIAGPEHYVESHTAWSCAAAPVRDPWTGEVLGAVDVSGPGASVRRAMLAVVGTTARLAQLEARQEHGAALDRLRAHAAPLLSRLPGRALAIDPTGLVAAVTGGTAPARVVLPASARPGGAWLPGLGAVSMEPLPGGWLLRVDDPGPDASAGAGPATVVLDLRGARPELRVTTPSQTWSHAPSPRHAQILTLLARHPEGRSASDLALALLGDPARVGTVRSEMSRLRRVLRALLETQPYRYADGVCVEVLEGPRGA